MAESKYEKYVIRHAVPAGNVASIGKIDWGRSSPPAFFLHPDDSLSKEFNTMLEYNWIVGDTASGNTEDRGPHRHDCPEMFMYLGTNPEDPDDLGAEVEFWMGEGEETEQIKFNTSSVIIAPSGVLHMPVFVRNVKRPVLCVVVAPDIGEALKHTIRYSPSIRPEFK